MTLIDNNTYFSQIVLSIEKATQFKYFINWFESGIWNSTEIYYVNLSNTYDENQVENNPRQSTPGFEIILVIITVLSALLQHGFNTPELCSG